MNTLGRNHAIFAMSAENPPAIVVRPGETLAVQTTDCYSGEVTQDPLTHEKTSAKDRNPATGPVFVEGAEPGDALCVHVRDIRMADHGLMVLRPGVGALGECIADLRVAEVKIEHDCAVYPPGFRGPLRPMIGVIGIAPKGGPVPTRIPGRHGGNMDTSDIGVGAKLYLAVQVPGALLALGDVHAAMGDGELSGTGIEIAAETTIRVDLIKNAGDFWPRVETDSYVITIASHERMREAISTATGEMVRLLMQRRRVGFEEALMLVGAFGDARISQWVNPACTARVVMPRSLVFGEESR